jgi:hypothetical protein
MKQLSKFFVFDLQGAVQVFSNNLWRATKERFFVNSIELLVPSSWNVGGDLTEVSAT